MKIFLAGIMPWKETGLYDVLIEREKPYILESFFYADKTTEKNLQRYGDFLLDSGAFTFMMGRNGKQVRWEDYVDKYSDFIVRNNIQKFFELDIDAVTNYQKVKELRTRLEKQTQRQCIPVWHKSRGKEDFQRIADCYPYIALGGIVSKEWRREEYKYFPWFISEAHKRKAKIHGLGFTQLAQLSQYHFDSVDSTAWLSGNRFGHIYQFNGEKMIKHTPPESHRIGDNRAAALTNFAEWVRFQKYAETHL